MDDAVAAMREVVKEKKKSGVKLDAEEACTVQLGWCMRGGERLLHPLAPGKEMWRGFINSLKMISTPASTEKTTRGIMIRTR